MPREKFSYISGWLLGEVYSIDRPAICTALIMACAAMANPNGGTFDDCQGSNNPNDSGHGCTHGGLGGPNDSR